MARRRARRPRAARAPRHLACWPRRRQRLRRQVARSTAALRALVGLAAAPSRAARVRARGVAPSLFQPSSAMRATSAPERLMSIPPSAAIAAITLLAALAMMAGEAVLSAFNEAPLRRQGAVEPPDDVYRDDAVGVSAVRSWRWRQRAPGTGRAPRPCSLGGLARLRRREGAQGLGHLARSGRAGRFACSCCRARRSWRAGPYRLIRHPNYVAVVGELVGAAAHRGRAGHGRAGRRRLRLADARARFASRTAHSGGTGALQ